MLARQLVLEAHRDGLPKVPACLSCNNKKSELEAYVSAVLPFGGRHSGAAAALEGVERRLAGNRRLERELGAGYGPAIDQIDGFRVALTGSIPFDSGKLEVLAALIARGLHHWHWRERLGQDDIASAHSVTASGDEILRQTLLVRGGERVSAEIGGGALAYEGLRRSGEPSVWRMQFYGGAVGIDDDGERSSAMWAFVGDASQVGMLNSAVVEPVSS